MTNRRDLNHIALGCVLAASAVGIYQLGRASAQNIPSMPTMFYGVSLDENGAPVTGTRDLRVRFFDGEMGGTQLCETLANSTTVTQGRARIALSESCRMAVQQNANVWVELAVGGNVVGARSRVGAVPYAVEAQRANDLTPAAQLRLTAEPECPRGYTRDNTASGIVLCRKPLAGGAFDEVVRVGSGPSAFWIDRYEASVWQNADGSGTQYGTVGDNYPSTFPDNGQVLQQNRFAFALSRSAVSPSTHITWFQAGAACRAAGKQLMNTDEWFAASAGTEDPGMSTGGLGTCLTRSPGPRETGRGSGCVSIWGVQDMIGNVFEWTNEWFASVNDGPEQFTDTWPMVFGVNYGSDLTWNIKSRSRPGQNIPFARGIPTAALRGGDHSNGEGSGTFSLYLELAPSNGGGPNVGFRCIIPRP